MRRCRSLVTALVLLIVVPTAAEAWDRLGHEVVARIAWEHMTEAARQAAVEALLAAPEDAGIAELMPDEDLPREVRDRILFQRAAVWSDLVRDGDHPGHRYDRPTWHYVNLFWREENGETVLLDWPVAGQAVYRLEHYRCALPDRATKEEVGLHLAWLLHIVGDLHQPLHASARVTRRDPRGDRGGNDFALDEHRNLHAFWDRIFSLTTERDADEPFYRLVDRVAVGLMERNPPEGMTEALEVTDPMEWARESVDIARTRIYLPELVRGEDPPAGYREHALQVAGPRAALAGYRIAEWLNTVFDPEAVDG